MLTITEDNKPIELDSTPCLWQMEDGNKDYFLCPFSSLHQGLSKGKFFNFSDVSDDMDGLFPLVMHYVNLVKRVDAYGASEYLNWMAGRNKLSIDIGYAIITRNNKSDSEAEITFKEDVFLKIAEIDDEPVLKKVRRMVGEFEIDYSWYSKSRLKRQEKYANIIEVYFNASKFYSE